MSSSVPRLFARIFSSRYMIALLLAVVIFIIGSLLIDGFSSAFSIRSMSVLAALLAIAAVGQTMVILIGGIDLSIPFLIGFGNVVAAKLNGDGYPFELVAPLVLLLASLIGAFSGGLSSSLKIHPLIVTLGVGTVVQGSVLLWTRGFPSGSAPDYVNNLVRLNATTGPLPFPAVIPLAFILMAILVWVMNRTVYGRQMYALGANPEAARLALVNPTRMWAITYAISAMFAAGAGILLLGFTGSAYAFVGNPYLFETIAAVVIGGTSLLGGRGSYLGTFIGAFVLVELKTLLIGQGLTQALIQAALGIVILILVSIYGREEHIRNQI